MSERYEKFHSEQHSPVDKIIRETYFQDYDYKGSFVDVGAADPIEINDSWHFEKNGWDVLCIEPNPKYVKKLKQVRANVIQGVVSSQPRKWLDFKVMTRDGDNAMSLSSIAPSQAYLDVHKTYKFEEETIRVRNAPLWLIMENFQEKVGFYSGELDVLKIDVEGWELDVLDSLDLSVHKPRLIILENLLHEPKYEEYMARFGYKISRKAAYNYFFVRSRHHEEGVHPGLHDALGKHGTDEKAELPSKD